MALCLSHAGLASPQEEKPVQEPKEEDINYALVRANPVLREVLSLHSPYSETANEESIEFKFRENWVDSQIDHFVKQTYLKLQALKSSVQRASEVSSDVGAIDPEKRARAAVVLRQALTKAEEQSKDLRTDLSMVLTELSTRDKFDINIDRAAEANGFKAEFESLSEQMTNAERSVRDYFFKPTHVTSLAELKQANMLEYLKRIERLARAIRDRL